MSEKTVPKDVSAPVLVEQHLSFAITLMEHLVVPTFVLDADQRVLIWNRACERLTDIPASEVIGTRDHWKAFYDAPRPCLADLVATDGYGEIDSLYTTHDETDQPAFGIHAENWCWMPRRRQKLYLAVDAGPVFDEAGNLVAIVETLRDITEKQIAQSKVIEQAGILKAHYDEHQRESELARRILDHQIRTDLIIEAGVKYSVMPATNFSGDMVLAARSPSGKRYAMLADATGHGLGAAVSILPMVQEFYRLVELSSPLGNLVEAINFLLSNSLPLGRFVAAAFACVDEAESHGEVWVGGVPDVLIFDDAGKLMRRFVSSNLPLGILRSSEVASGVENFAWDSACRVVMLSDGVIEATDVEGRQFGEDVLLETIKSCPGEHLIDRLHQALETHLQGLSAHDDMSVLVIDCPVAQ